MGIFSNGVQKNNPFIKLFTTNAFCYSSAIIIEINEFAAIVLLVSLQEASKLITCWMALKFRLFPMFLRIYFL